MITKTIEKVGPYSYEMTIGTGFYSKAAYDALFLVNCLEAGCELISDHTIEIDKDRPCDISLNGWADVNGHDVQYTKYNFLCHGPENPWHGTNVIYDFSTGEILLKRAVDSIDFRGWGKKSAEQTMHSLARQVRSTYEFVLPFFLANNDICLETEGTSILNPYSFFSWHIFETKAPFVTNWKDHLSRNFGRPTYKHNVDLAAINAVLDCWENDVNPSRHPALTTPRLDPFRLQAEREVYEETKRIKKEAEEALLESVVFIKDAPTEEKSKMFYSIIKKYESKQREMMNGVQ